MRILHVISGLAKAAGTSTFCGEVCNQLAAHGHDVTIAFCNPAAPDIYPLDKKVRLVSIESVLHSPTLHANYDIIHIHGLWSFCLHKIVKKNLQSPRCRYTYYPSLSCLVYARHDGPMGTEAQVVEEALAVVSLSEA